MRSGTISLALALLLCLAVPSAAVPQKGGKKLNTKITPVWEVVPNAIPSGRTSRAFVTLTNGNTASTAPFQPGDVYTLVFDAAMGIVLLESRDVMVSSATLSAEDFEAQPGLEPNQIKVLYRGAAKPFAPGDSLSLRVTISAPAVAGTGHLAVQGPLDASRFNVTHPARATAAVVDFPFGTGGQGIGEAGRSDQAFDLGAGQETGWIAVPRSNAPVKVLLTFLDPKQCNGQSDSTTVTMFVQELTLYFDPATQRLCTWPVLNGCGTSCVSADTGECEQQVYGSVSGTVRLVLSPEGRFRLYATGTTGCASPPAQRVHVAMSY